MAWDYEMARAIKQSRGGKGGGAYYIATVTRESPLTFSALGGEIMASGASLTLTKTAASYSGVTRWRTGDKAAALIGGTGLLVIDKLG